VNAGKLIRVGGGGEWRTCATRDDEPRPVWTESAHHALVNAGVWCVYYCRTCVAFITAVPSTKLFAWGGGGNGGHVLRETTSRSLCGLVCPWDP
jgi:hypothetical protein